MKVSLNTIKDKAIKSSLDVDDMIEAALMRLEGLPELLESLEKQLNWGHESVLEDGTRVIPFAKWSKVCVNYCRGGLKGLEESLHQPGFDTFILSFLEELHSRDAVEFIYNQFSENILKPDKDLELSIKISGCLNLILCTKPTIVVSEDLECKIANFSLNLLELLSDESDKANCILLLRGVGNIDSIKLL